MKGISAATFSPLSRRLPDRAFQECVHIVKVAGGIFVAQHAVKSGTKVCALGGVSRKLGANVINAGMIRIVLVDRQEIFRDGLKRLLHSEPGFEVVGGAGDAPKALQLVRDLQPDVLLLDLALRNGESIGVLKALAETGHSVRTIAMSEGAGPEAVEVAVQHGARGAIRKESSTAHLFDSIRIVFEDENWICRDQPAAPPAAPPDPQSKSKAASPVRFKLTPREMDIISAVAAGDSNKSIARKLSLSEDTVKHHVSHVFDKLGVFSRLELALFAFNHNLVQDTIDYLSQ
jgi:DNA-binding NarL/FixJ family response regulator